LAFFRSVHKEHLKRIHSLNSHQVEVFDSLTNETTVYASNTEAAKAIGCDKSTITKAIKYQKENGVSRLVKKRFFLGSSVDLGGGGG
jgi:Fic family protein